MVFIACFADVFAVESSFKQVFLLFVRGLRRYEVVSTDHLFGNIPEENFLLYPVA